MEKKPKLMEDQMEDIGEESQTVRPVSPHGATEDTSSTDVTGEPSSETLTSPDDAGEDTSINVREPPSKRPTSDDAREDTTSMNATCEPPTSSSSDDDVIDDPFVVGSDNETIHKLKNTSWTDVTEESSSETLTTPDDARDKTTSIDATAWGAEASNEPDYATIRKLMFTFKGPPVAPDEFRKINWITMEADLQDIMASGMIPEDTVASAGLDPNCYEHFKKCVTQIQEELWEGDLRKALSVLRGSRRVFSASSSPALQHVFRGPPLEVLANLYFDGIGVLPKDRMLIQDPFHHSSNPESICDE